MTYFQATNHTLRIFEAVELTVNTETELLQTDSATAVPAEFTIPYRIHISHGIQVGVQDTQAVLHVVYDSNAFQNVSSEVHLQS